MNMVTAKEARQMRDDYLNEESVKEISLVDVEEQIKLSARKGASKTIIALNHLDGYLTEKSIKVLEERGFNVGTLDLDDGTIVVGWSKK